MTRLTSLVAFCLTTFSVAAAEDLSVIRVTPAADDVEEVKQIVFEFNRTVVPVGRMDRRAEEIGATITPPLACEWRWLNTKTLACQISDRAAISPATRYRIVLPPSIRAADGSTLAAPVTAEFLTARPRVTQYWFHTWRSPTLAEIYVAFNTHVEKQSVEQHLFFRSPSRGRVRTLVRELEEKEETRYFYDEKSGFFLVGSRRVEVGQKRAWIVSPERELGADETVQLEVEPGVRTPFGLEPGAEQRTVVEFHTFPEFRFLGVTCQSTRAQEILFPPGPAAANESRCSPLAPIMLTFSSPIIKEALKDEITIVPDLTAGRTEVDPWERVYSSSRLDQPHRVDRRYTVSLPYGLKAFREYTVSGDGAKIQDEFGRPLAEPLQVIFRTDHRLPELNVDGVVSTLEKEVDTHLPVVITNLQSLIFNYQRLTSHGVSEPLSATIPVDGSGPAEDIAYHFPLKIRDLLTKRSGAVLGYLTSEPSRPGDPPLIFSQVTPFHVHLKLGHYNTVVWVTRLSDGQPVADVEVDVWKGQPQRFPSKIAPLAHAKTDRDGLAYLPGASTLDPEMQAVEWWYSDGSQEMVFLRARKGEDIALVPVSNDLRAYAREADGSYVSHSAMQRYGHIKSWGTTAQGVYRLGDEVEFKLFVRNDGNKRFEPAPAGRYKLRVVDPLDKVVFSEQDITLSEFGSHSGKFLIPLSGAVGYYRFVLEGSFSEFEWEPMQVLVSDFTPSPFRVSTTLNGTLFRVSERVEVNTAARLHAGGPYASARTRVHVRVLPSPLPELPAPLGGFFFETFSPGVRQDEVFEGETVLDSNGDAKSEFAVRDPKVLYGSLLVESAVRDDRGRSIANEARAKFAARNRYVGVRAAGWLLEKGKAATIDLLVVDEQGRPVAGAPVSVAVTRQEKRAARVKGAGNAYLTNYETVNLPVSTCTVESALSAVSCSFTPPAPGEYKVTASVSDTTGATHSTALERYAIGSGYTLWETEAGERLEIVPEKKEWRLGERARFLIKNPFSRAQALITTERYGVQKSWVETFTDSSQTLSFPITAEHIPGFYLSVVLMSPRVDKPLADGQVDLGKPAMRMGYAEVAVSDPAKQLIVEVTPHEKEYRPRTTARVDLAVKTRQGDQTPAEVAVAVLDEAVFDLISAGSTYFDPYKGFYKLEPLDVRNFNTILQLVGRRSWAKKGANSGGGGGADLKLRSVSKFVSYWNPAVRLETGGKTTISFETPDNLTGWRVLVFAVTKTDRFGLGEGHFAVNQPIELRSALPNQVTEGDGFSAAFTVMNRTDKNRMLTVDVSAEGPVEFHGEKKFTVGARPFERSTVRVPMRATASGEIRFTVSARDNEERDALGVGLWVHKRSSLETAATYGTTTENEVREPLEIPSDIRTDVGSLSVAASSSVIGSLEGAFKYLRDYPYFCWEQILTKGVMAAHFQRLKKYLPQDFMWPKSETLAERTLQAASSFQAPNGGMTYFVPADEYADPYLSAYTAIAFNWLRAQGYKIPEHVEAKLHEYLLELLRRDTTPSFYTTGMASTVRAVAIAALAERKKIQLDEIERHTPHAIEMSLFGKAHLLLAAVRAGARTELIAEVLDRILAQANETSGKFVFSEVLDDGFSRILTSTLRDNCTVLSALLALRSSAVDDQRIFQLVRTITARRKNRDHWENTQENMFCMNALVEYSTAFEKEEPRFALRAALDSTPLGEVSFTGFENAPQEMARPLRKGDAGRKGELVITRQGAGRAYYAVRLAYAPAALKTTAINSGIEVVREFSAERDGRWEKLKNPLAVRQGELIRVDLFVTLPAARNFVVINDPVPGGLEAVNRDLATSSTVDADKAQSTFSGDSFWYRYDGWHEFAFDRWSFYHKEYRHDAVRFYSDYLPAGNYHLSYVAQAISGGDFVVLPTQVEEMYDPDVFGKWIPEKLLVEADK